MKITCILTSHNRPRMVRDALRSVAGQTHTDYELLVFDDSTLLDIYKAVSEFKFTEVRVFHNQIGAEARALTCRLGINCNAGLAKAKGDLVCFLCDDDFYYPGWFAAAAKFFTENPDTDAGFGRLWYLDAQEARFPDPDSARGIWFDSAVIQPYAVLDHNQVIHRRFDPPFRWPEDAERRRAPDAHYFQSVALSGRPFHPIPADAVVKRRHGMNMQNKMHELGTEKGEGLREKTP
jgi:spore maturation protein CgeD